jgi:RNA polymerase sigma-70 factor (ECF subfamily)
MQPLQSDAEVLHASLADPSRFEVIYRRHGPAVHSYLRRRLGDPVAEDVCADVFVRAFRGRARYDVRHDTALPWLFGIAGNLIADHRRAEGRRLRALERLAAAGAGGQATDTADAFAELAPDLTRALRRLPAADRDALLLVAWGELSYEETAHALDVPIGTVRSRIARARRRLAHDTDLRPIALTGETHA